MYNIVKYTYDTRDSRKAKLEWKIRRDKVGYNMPRIHCILCHMTLHSILCMESGLVIWVYNEQDQILKKTWLGDIYGKWVQRHRKCVQHQGEYFETLCCSPN